MYKQSIPLNCLILSPKNVRQISPTRVNEMAASIHAIDLLNPLTVIPNGKPGVFEVIAGRIRLAALQKLASTGARAVDHPIDCTVMEVSLASQASLAENVIREPMHPADEFEAYRQLVDDGHSIDELCANFGQSRRHVQQRLSLARVHPELIRLYRDGLCPLACLEAYAITDDQAAQLSHWKKAQNWQRNPHDIRTTLTNREIDARSDKRARFIGLDVYEAAGGTVRRDLFGGEHAGYLNDAQLLDQLATVKLLDEKAKVAAEGWSWVDVRDDFGYVDLAGFTRTHPTRREPTAQEKADLESAGTELQRLADIERVSELTDDQEDQRETLIARKMEFDHLRQSWSDRQKAKSGAILSIDGAGRLVIERGLVRGANKATKGSTSAAAAKSRGTKASGSAEPETRELSQALVQRLTAQRSAACAAELTLNPDRALVFLTHSLVLPLLYDDFAGMLADSAIKVRPTLNRGELLKRDPSIEGSAAWNIVDVKRRHWQDVLPKESEQLLGTLLGWLDNELNGLFKVRDLLAFCVANTVSISHHSEQHAVEDAVTLELAEALGQKMADFWQPTVDSYLGSVPKARILEALTEAGKPDDAKRLAKAKTAVAAAEAEALLRGSGWVPKILHTPGAAIAAVAAAVAKASPPKGKKTKALAAPPTKASKPEMLARKAGSFSKASKAKPKPAKSPKAPPKSRGAGKRQGKKAKKK